MSDWVNSALSATGEPEAVSNFQRAAKGVDSVLSFDALYPVPTPLRNDPSDWQKKHWGCKWDAIDPRITTQSSDSITYLFDTTNSPPIEFVKRLSRMFPELVFELESLSETNEEGRICVEDGLLFTLPLAEET